MKKIFTTTLLATAALFSLGVQAAPSEGDKLKEQLTPILKSMNPNLAIDSVTPIKEIPGWYEVVHNRKNIFYTSADGQYVLQGVLLDIKNMKSITDERKAELSFVPFNKLPVAPITYKKGKGTHKLAVFSDPNCPYCKRLEGYTESLNDVTITVYPYPILGPKSVNQAISVLCEKKPAEAWKKMMIEGVLPTAATCKKGEDAVAKFVSFGQTWELGGTPVLVFENGKVVNGAIPAEEIEEHFKAVKAEKDAKKSKK